MLAISKLKITQEIYCIHFKISAKTCLVLLQLWMHGSMAQALPSRAVRSSERHHRNSQVFFYSFHSQISHCLMLHNDKTTPHIYKWLKWFSSEVENSKHLRTLPCTNTQCIQQGYPICKKNHIQSLSYHLHVFQLLKQLCVTSKCLLVDCLHLQMLLGLSVTLPTFLRENIQYNLNWWCCYQFCIDRHHFISPLHLFSPTFLWRKLIKRILKPQAH